MALRTRAALVALAASLVVAGMAALGASAATAATGKLTITPTGYNDQYYVIVAGDFSGYYAGGVDVAVQLWGEDEWFDDFLFAPYGTSYESPGSNNYGREFYVSGGTLNEDWGRDEVYGVAKLYDHRNGRLIQTIRTNTLTGSWS